MRRKKGEKVQKIDEIRELFSNKRATQAEKVSALLDFDIAQGADDIDGVQDLAMGIVEAALEWSETIAERDLRPAETTLAKAAFDRLRIWSQVIAEKGDHQRRIWADIRKSGDEAIRRVASQDDSDKPKTRREYEAFLRLAGHFSKAESRELAANFQE